MTKRLTYTLFFTFSLVFLAHHSSAQQTLTWMDLVQVSISGDTITKSSSGTDWTAGAASEERLDYLTDGWIETIVNETNLHRAIGLSEQNIDAGLNTIDFMFLLLANGNIQIRENNTVISQNTPYQTGDTLRIERLGGDILYKKNGTTIYTSTQTSVLPLIVDLSLRDQGASLIKISSSLSFLDPTSQPPPIQQSISWKDTVGVTFMDNKIIRTAAGTEWTAGAASVEKLDYLTDGWVETVIHENYTQRAIGLSEQNIDAGLNTIDFMFLPLAIGNLQIRENNSVISQNILYQTGDTLRIERLGGNILYKKNGIILYTSTQISTSPLIVDLSMRDRGSSLMSISTSSSFINHNNTQPLPVEQSINWTDTVDVTFIGDKIIKSASNTDWTTGAASVERLEYLEDGWLETIVNETYTQRAFGLSEFNLDAGLNTIDFMLLLLSNGYLQVRENNTIISQNTPYSSGDTLRIERLGSNILYKKNGSIIYTSTQTSTSPLLADLSFRDYGASLMSLSTSSSFFNNDNDTNNGQWGKLGNTLYHLDSVTIGTDIPIEGHLLSVKGKIAAQGVKVTLDGWADFVFKNEYDLMSIKELQVFIEKYGHLPDVPKTSEVLSQGINLGEMNKLLLQKIEELTLHLIQQNKRIEKLESEIKKKN
ncbi:hypothetical protein [Roseivirga sp. E12]|uniref:hypothetical protein n=1 Tax=Roseivirga sp. E12 TaxID=2819237 RepID=UPI001ABCF82C|nr:hypothetical protein [Roseivirga sp. E12]MBO3700278.1 hypothetical protein [Roseivirga sp. E12]